MTESRPPLRNRVSRSRLAAGIAGITLIASGCGASAEDQPTEPPVAASPAPASSTPSVYPVGYDVSWAQCDKPLPGKGAFAIIQITGGRADLMSPCLREQAEWADSALDGSTSQPKDQYYIWPANPGKEYRGQTIKSWPKEGSNRYGKCTGSSEEACSYEYGLMRGRQAMKFAGEKLGTKALGTIFIDVESGVGDEPGTWQTVSSHNLAAIEGYEAAITETGSTAGIYSNKQHLATVLNDTDARALSHLPQWTTGSGTAGEAHAACAEPFIEGAKVVLSQYKIDQDSGKVSNFDLNVACP